MGGVWLGILKKTGAPEHNDPSHNEREPLQQIFETSWLGHKRLPDLMLGPGLATQRSDITLTTGPKLYNATDSCKGFVAAICDCHDDDDDDDDDDNNNDDEVMMMVLRLFMTHPFLLLPIN